MSRTIALRFRPAAHAPILTDTFTSYAKAATTAREALGLDRLAPWQAAALRAAVERHKARAEARDQAAPSGGFLDLERLRETLREATQDAVVPFTTHHRSKGKAHVRVSVGDQPKAWMSAPTKWVSGRGGFGHVVTDTTEYITVCPAWRTRVEARGLARLDGMLTTHAMPVLTLGEVTVYQASWVRQRAGYNLGTESGFIAYHEISGTSYHATSTPIRAARALFRKLKAQAIPHEERERQRTERAERQRVRKAAALAKLTGQLSRLDVSEVGHVVVSRADSLRAGNCVDGTDAFIERFVPGQTSATVLEIAQALRWTAPANLSDADLTLARQLGAAVLVAVRRDRQARRALGV